MKVNLLDFKDKLKIKRSETGTFIWDSIRKKYLVLTPEEMVRQLCLEHLVEKIGYPRTKFNAEKAVSFGGRNYRYDLLLFDKSFQPFLLIECKAPSVKLSTETFEQVANYNRQFRVPYLLITNGPNMYIAEINWESGNTHFLRSFPTYPT